ncbi:hypothetical protein [Sphingomonas sp.]|uniref:hypothetical protein n=1 Tax=Sphingomonas sp. TaxID=28214 RepID=UPI0025DC95A7|nr:hypothetical protein [Sphingomonas sp.]
MRRLVPLTALLAVAACTVPLGDPEPSLAPRPAEAVDPRVPVPGDVPTGVVDTELAVQLGALVAEVGQAVPAFDAKQATAEQAAASAGPMASESWVAAQQALSLLIEQYGVTTRAAANIDQLGSSRLQGQHWISPADQQAIAAAATEVAAISDRQSAAIDRLKDQLAR